VKTIKRFAAFPIIALLLISQGIVIVHAQILTKDFGETNFNSSDYSGHNIFCTIDVTAIIQTEPNGNWIENNTYQVNWTITMTYVNQSVVNSNDFSIVFYNPENLDLVPLHVVTSETTVTPQSSGTLSATFTPESASSNFTLNSDFALKVYNNGNIMTSGSWLQSFNNSPLSIAVERNQPQVTNSSPSINPIYFFVMVIALVIVVIGIGAYAYTKRKKYPLPPPPL